jgi:DAK2 domain fusion protein YloV
MLYRMLVSAANSLENYKATVNSLNVFPVPDGDTGTNMSMTMMSAIKEVQRAKDLPLDSIAEAAANGSLMGARGNSGVILSQLLRGFARGTKGKGTLYSRDLALAFREGVSTAYKAVMKPTEGTILTVARESADRAVELSKNVSNIITLMEKVFEYAETVLDRTPDMLPVLKKAKVVDAGGMGLLIILKGMYEALKNDIQAKIADFSGDANQSYNPVASLGEQEIKFGYCTEFFVLGQNINANEFRDELEPHGDSMIVVGVEDAVKVHIHTNDPGLVLSKAVKLGELSKIKIDNMREQHRHVLHDENALSQKENTQPVSEETIEETKKYGFVSVAMGEGIKNIFEDFGVDYVIEGGQTMNPSTQDILNCINKINAENIFILPNNKNIIMAANQAAELTDKNIIVIPTKTIPQGITSVTVFDPEASLDDNKKAMEEAIKNVTTGQITNAVRDTEMDGKNIGEGDILGLVEGKISEVGKDIYEVCQSVINNIVTEDSELITVFYGQDVEEDKVSELVGILEDRYPDKDIQSYNGEQPLYYFIVAVE